MQIPYRHLAEYQPVDIAKLRPGTSYKSLIEKRTHPIDALIARFGKIPDDLLTTRACPTCGGNAEKQELAKDHMSVVRCGVWLDDPRDFPSFNKVFREYFGANPPARACVVSSMVVDCKVEIDCVAYRG